MTCKEINIGEEAVRAREPLTFAQNELRLECRIGKIPLQSRAEHKPQLAIECNKMPIKCTIEMCCKAEAIPWVKALFWELTPR